MSLYDVGMVTVSDFGLFLKPQELMNFQFIPCIDEAL